MFVMYLHSRMFCTLAGMSSIPICAKIFYMQEHFFTLTDTIPPIFSVITKVWPHANRAVVTNNSTVIIEAVLIPSGICLPRTELLPSPFRTEFSMGSRSRRYRRSLRRHRRFLLSYRRFLRSYRRSLRRSAAAPSPIVARLAKHNKTLLNIVKHHETHAKHCDTS